MTVNEINLENYRNLLSVHAEFSPEVNVICGENAQGKTNLLESICFLSCGRSWRTRFDREIINFDRDFAYLKGSVTSRGRESSIEMTLGRGYRKKVSVNGVSSRVSELGEYLSAVIFSPEDLWLLRDGAGARRRFMNAAISRIRPRYFEALSEYEKLLEHKKRILRDFGEKPDLLKTLPDFETRMCLVGSVMIHYRAHFAEKLEEMAKGIHTELSGGREELSIRYQTVSTVTDPLAPAKDIFPQLTEHIKSHHAAEMATGSCLSGPHKDELEILINGRSARSFSSQGQTRTAALSLKLAEMKMIENHTGEAPVLLLDDVLSELDSRRGEFVIERIKGSQVIITCCNDTLPGLPAKVMRMENGVLK